MMISYDASTLMKNVCLTIDIRITGLRAFRVRARLATWLFRLGAWILGTNLDVIGGDA